MSPLAITGVALLVYVAWRGTVAATETVNNFRFYLGSIGIPKNGGGVWYIPVTVYLDNHSIRAVPVQKVLVTIYKETSPGNWSFVSSSQPSLANVEFNPTGRTQLNLEMNFGLLDAAQIAMGILQKPGTQKFKFTIESWVSGIRFPEEFTKVL